MNEKQKVTDALRAAELILRYLHGVLTENEQTELDIWIEESEENRMIFSDMTNPRKLKPQMDEYEKFDVDAGYNRFMKRYFPLRVCLARVASVVKRYGIAATIILIVSAALAIVYIRNRPEYKTMVIPKNQTKDIVLSDGTKVTLNGFTTFTYPATFTGMDRTVSLTGNGYFAVADDPSKPFYVNINTLDVQLTGAAFHVDAYTNEVLVNAPSFKEVMITDSSITFDPHPGQPLRIEGRGRFRIIKP